MSWCLPFRIVLLLTICTVCACGDQEAPGATDAPEVDVGSPTVSTAPEPWSVGKHPSSVAIDGGRVYVAHVGPVYRPGEKNGNGYIVYYDANGRLEDTLVKGLDSPLGMAIVGEILYFTSVDHVRGVDKATGRLMVSYLATDLHGLLGAIVSGGGGQLFVADPSAGILWTIPLDGAAPSKVNTVFGISDLAYDPSTGKLYASSYVTGDNAAAYVYELDPTTGRSLKLSEQISNLGSVEVVGSRLLFTVLGGANAPGALFSIDLSSKAVSQLLAGSQYRGLGPFATLGDGLAFLPVIYGSEVAIVRIP